MKRKTFFLEGYGLFFFVFRCLSFSSDIISNTFHNDSHDNSSLIASAMNYQPTFNTIEKIVELYERLLQSEREKVELLREMKKD